MLHHRCCAAMQRQHVTATAMRGAWRPCCCSSCHTPEHLDVTRPRSNGWTALQKAAGRGHVAVVQLLLQHGADVNAKGVKCVLRASFAFLPLPPCSQLTHTCAGGATLRCIVLRARGTSTLRACCCSMERTLT